jgi:hypothetical protein
MHTTFAVISLIARNAFHFELTRHTDVSEKLPRIKALHSFQFSKLQLRLDYEVSGRDE